LLDRSSENGRFDVLPRELLQDTPLAPSGQWRFGAGCRQRARSGGSRKAGYVACQRDGKKRASSGSHIPDVVRRRDVASIWNTRGVYYRGRSPAVAGVK
jgi:hypothetical protein